ncbi:MAG: sulfatase [Candidatus Nealsonbacteria bacterium]|nr:sulfatase [Candidatus Nealsonbacteria bacterium]
MRQSITRGLYSVVCLLACAAGAAEPATPDDRPVKPNIVFILIDDMGWPDVACYGHKFHETPQIDRLCAQGMKFTDFYAATPVCSSTRATIQSGQYAARVGITDFIPGHWRPMEKLIVPPIENALPPAIRTPGDALKAAGYATGYFGKWHLGPEATAGPDVRGYDVTARTIGREFQAWRKTKEAGPKRIDLLTDQTLWFIEQNKHRPFFVTLSHHAVHIRLEATPAAIEKYRNKPKPAEGVNHPVYAAMIEDLDRSVGRIVTRLDELGLTRRTLLVFTSDNGGLRKIYTGVGETVSTNAPLRDEKGTIYEGGIRVPMIVRLPGRIAPGTVCHEPTTTADLLPTFCEAAGAKLPDQPIDGTSLMPLLSDPDARLARDAIYFHYPHYHHSRPAGAIRAGDLKLIEFFDGTPLELYNLKDDIAETTNLAEQEPAEARRLQKQLAVWRATVGARMPTPNPKYDPARAAEWWNRRTNKPLDIKAMAEHYRSRK